MIEYYTTFGPICLSKIFLILFVQCYYKSNIYSSHDTLRESKIYKHFIVQLTLRFRKFYTNFMLLAIFFLFTKL